MMMCSYNQQSQKSSEEETREKWKETFQSTYFLGFHLQKVFETKENFWISFPSAQKRKKKDDARGDDDDDDADDDIEKRFGR